MSELMARAEDDPLTAPAAAVPTKGAGDPSLLDCARVFVRHPSPPYLFGAVVLAFAARAVQGQFSWRDLVMVAGLIPGETITLSLGIYHEIQLGPTSRYSGDRTNRPY